MNGSSSGSRTCGATAGQPLGWRLGPTASKGPCVLCRKTRLPSVFCTDREQVSRRGGAVGTVDGQPRGRGEAVVCKECCIGVLAGHRCVWWDLCWNI